MENGLNNSILTLASSRAGDTYWPCRSYSVRLLAQVKVPVFARYSRLFAEETRPPPEKRAAESPPNAFRVGFALPVFCRTVHSALEPKYEGFRPRTIWNLSDAFTSAFKKDPIPQVRAPAKLRKWGSRLAPPLIKMGRVGGWARLQDLP
jgi:hypothetical protein